MANLSRPAFPKPKAAIQEGLHLSEQTAFRRNFFANLVRNDLSSGRLCSRESAGEERKLQFQPPNAMPASFSDYPFSDYHSHGLACAGAQATLGKWRLGAGEASVL
jgi:hypothetical protein